MNEKGIHPFNRNCVLSIKVFLIGIFFLNYYRRVYLLLQEEVTYVSCFKNTIVVNKLPQF